MIRSDQIRHLSSRFLAVMAAPLVLGLIATTFVPGRASAQAAGLVAAYSFNEGAGTAIADASGSSNSGTVSGASWTGQGVYGSALSFDGSNDLVTVSDAGSLDLTTGMTLEAWVYPTALSGWRTVILKETSGNLSYALYAHDDAPQPAAYIGGTSVSGSGALPLNTWTHLATTYDGGTFRLYVNGVQAGSGSAGTISPSNAALRIGGNNVWGEWFQGRLDEIRIYNRALTSGEIQTDMNTPIDGSPPASSCDLTQNGAVEADDVYLSVDMALGSTPCTADIVGLGVCNVIVTQRIVNAALGQPCVTGGGGQPQSVLLSWIASPSPNIAGHNVYRATTSGGPYTKLNSSLVASTQFSDTTVQGSQTYYYVVTAVDTGNLESAYSNQATAVVPPS